ncbi:MAG: FtsQ-type POTRA domain-containing protein [Endomicrobium sp.]|jgi:cell division protein FtsQ|nr:FtsQ-type POTRA domain-containing protein [Endomicrobium sp.]
MAKRSNLRSQRKKSKVFNFLIFLFCVSFFVYFGKIRILKIINNLGRIIIKDIEIAGSKNITKAEIKELLPFKIGDSFVGINLSKTGEEIKKIKPELKNIVIIPGWHKIKIKFYERIPEAFVLYNNKIFGVDFDNVIFPLRGFMNKIKVPVIIYKSAYERRLVLDFIKKFKAISGSFFFSVLDVKFNNIGDVVFTIKNNTTVIWGDWMYENLLNKFRKFMRIYNDATSKYRKIEYIDMSFYSYGKAIVKPII